MCSIKEIKTITHLVFNSYISAITKLLFSLPLVPQSHSSCTTFLNFLIRYFFVRQLVSPPNFIIYRYQINVATNFFRNFIRVAMVLTTSINNSCQLKIFCPNHYCVNWCWYFLLVLFLPKTCDTCRPTHHLSPSFYSAIQLFLLVKTFWF